MSWSGLARDLGLRSDPKFAKVKWEFPDAPNQPVTCNGGYKMPSWFDLADIPVTTETPDDEESLMQVSPDTEMHSEIHAVAPFSFLLVCRNSNCYTGCHKNGELH